MKLGMIYALAGHTNNLAQWQLIPGLVESADNRARFWDGVRDDVANGAESVMFHRMPSEPTQLNEQDYATRWMIQQFGTRELVEYLEDMERHLYQFHEDCPGTRIVIYHGSLLDQLMTMLEIRRNRTAWNELFMHQLEPVFKLHEAGADVYAAFDESALLKQGDRGLEAIRFLHRLMLPGRCIVESIPFEDSPLSGMPAWALEDRYQLMLRQHPGAVMVTPHLMRIVNGHTDRHVADVADECVVADHDLYVAPAKLNQANMSIRELVERVNAQRHPDG